MSSRRTLVLLLVLAVVAGGLRLGIGSWFNRYNDGLEASKVALRGIVQDTEYLRVRRANSVVAESDEGYLTHFQVQARTQHMAPVTAPMRESQQKNAIEREFTLGFEKDPPHFSRDQITRFLFNTELLMPRLRTTKLVLQPAGEGSSRRRKGPDPGAERDDLWEVTQLTFTQLTPTAKTRE
ncbi:MAG: hypothetical protein ISR76_00380 [Planctomycetes bacterium]|nr:hypothetical protein [Planctomycetota bacterium]MBL7007427.1 hypothetical protein [Planctomycetota bacterium]